MALSGNVLSEGGKIMAIDENKSALNSDKGDDELKEVLLKELEKADSVPDAEFDSEEVLGILTMLGHLEKKEAQRTQMNMADSPNKEMVSPEERAAAFIEQFNKKNGTKFAKTMKELKDRQLKAKKQMMRVAMIFVLLIGSFGIANQVTMASSNQSIFEFIGMKATQLKYEMQSFTKGRNASNVQVFEAVSSKWEEILAINDFTLYLPTYFPSGFKAVEIKQSIIRPTDREIAMTFANEECELSFQMLIFHYENYEGSKNFFLGDELNMEEAMLKSGEAIILYVGEDCIKTMFYREKTLYILSSNIKREEFLKIIDSMEVLNEKNK